MSERWEQMLGIADATMVPMDMRNGSIKQASRTVFRLKDTPLHYGLELVHGYHSADYETAALVFHVRKHAYLLVEKSRLVLHYYLLNLAGYTPEVLEPKERTPRAVISAANKHKMKLLGSTEVHYV